MLVDHLLKTKKEFKNLKIQETRVIFTKMNLIRLDFCTVSWAYVNNDLNGEEIIGTFYEKELQKTNQIKF